MRKALQCEQGKLDLQKEFDRLSTEKEELERQLVDGKQKADQAERRALELRTAEDKKHVEEIAFIKKANQQLKVINCSSTEQ